MPADLVHDFIVLWESSDSPPDLLAFLQRHAGAGTPEKVRVLLADQPRRWRTSAPLRVEDYLAGLPELASDPEIKLQLVVGEFQTRHGSDTAPSVEEYSSRFPDLGDSLTGKLLDVLDPYRTSAVPTEIQRIGRYRSLRMLGEGAFGRVWLAFDDELQRQVAIKVPKAERFQRPEDAEAYLAEARTLAGLDHPHIVPVYDVGRTADGSIYVVSRFIEGRNLAERIGENLPSPEDAAALLAQVAAALQHAHQKHLIHRDIKPANILIEDRTGAPFVADFGLAITEENSLGDSRLAGTPAYMSPEQARGEGHRLDGRSDIFAVGVVFYELLTGKRPFRGSTHNELLHQVITTDPRPPRELNGSIPAELERICLKALSKRASDRYATAAEMADDLAHWRQGAELPQTDLPIVPKGLRSFDPGDADFFLQLLPGPRNRTGLPESLQFWKTRLEESDPEQTFSVGLIYGPSGCGKSSLMKAGLLPRLSKEVLAVYVEATPDDTETRILRGARKLFPELGENLGLAETFAFLRRRTGKKVVVVLDQFEQWLHAHRTEQETELVAALRQCDGGQLQAVVMVRDDFWLAASRFMSDVEVELVQGSNLALVDLFDIDHAQKVLCKFGQAYSKLPQQWDKASPEDQRFVEAVANGLAQDGKVVSVRLALFAEMVKGKPWTPATLAEVGGTEGIGVNFLEETFASRTANPKHRLHQEAARAVLKALLPEVGADIKGHMRSHGELLAAAGYQNRPNEFHELLRMLDSELRLITPTDPEGAQSATGSDPNSKFYQLTHDYLVPSLRDWLTRKQKETAKGRAELLLADRAAVWNARPENQQLPSLMEWSRILWLTECRGWSLSQTKMMRQARRHHLLRGAVVSLMLVAATVTGLLIRNQVLAREQKNLAKALVGRVFDADTSQVLSVVNELKLYRAFTDPLLKQEREKSQNDPHKQLHASLALLPVDESQANYLFQRLVQATPQEVMVIREALTPHRDKVSANFWSVLEDKQRDPNERLRAACALATLAPEDQRWEAVGGDVASLLVSQKSFEIAIWADALAGAANELFPSLAEFLVDENRNESARGLIATVYGRLAAKIPSAYIRLEQSLCKDAPFQESSWKVCFYKWDSAGPMNPPADWNSVLKSPIWQEVTMPQLHFQWQTGLPSEDLPTDFFGVVATTDITLTTVKDGFQITFDDGVRVWVDDKIVFEKWSFNHQTTENVPVRIEPGRHRIKVEYFQIDGGYALGFLWHSSTTDANDPEADDILAKRQASVGVALAAMGRGDKVWPLLKNGPDPSVRSFLIDRFAATGVDPGYLFTQLDKEKDPTIQQALLLSVGEYGLDRLGSDQRRKWIPLILVYYRDHTHPGVHSAIEGLLQKWGEEQAMWAVDQENSVEKVDWRRSWYRTKQGQTMAILMPGEFWMGDGPVRRATKIERAFALSTKQVTLTQFLRFRKEHKYPRERTPSNDCPVTRVSWFDAAAYCNWLSEQEGIPCEQWCYTANDKGEYATGMSIPEDWEQRIGYRLPTEAEWEYACRSGSETKYMYGDAEELLPKYGWLEGNNPWTDILHPVGTLRPNAWGLFDMYGNITEWCHDSPKTRLSTSAQAEFPHMVRGGRSETNSQYRRTGYRDSYGPSHSLTSLGFRLATRLSGVSISLKQ